MSLFRPPKAAPAKRMAYVSPPPPYITEDPNYANTAITTTESSLQIIAVRSAVDLIASLVSELPVDIFSGTGTDKKQRPIPGYLDDPAGDGTGRPDWIYQTIESWLLRGNLYGDILDRRGAHPTQVLPMHPDCVSHTVVDGRSVWRVNGVEFDPERMWHRRVNPVPGVVLGLSPIAAHAASLGLSLSATRFGYQWFRDGGHPSALLSRDDEGGEQLDEDGAKTAKARFMAALKGGSREPLVMGGGWKYQALQVAPEESQFLQTQGATSAECARIFGPGVAEILGYETGGALTYNNPEHRMGQLLVLSLNRWVNRIERLLTEMLPRPQYARLNRDALLESTTLDRYRAHELALRNRWKTPNEVREHEDMKPVAWGDEPNPATAGTAPGTTEEDEQ